ncbi:MAG TPA: hypothetical protein PKO20_03220 [Clostridiales bacterium]|nr:hypothetical protein [Clostridiales bacterium]HOJ36044.1 hypothetical protein [Clostridiales bacterium]HPU67795.1 hypothetical protein [Clostridiales bacterium]
MTECICKWKSCKRHGNCEECKEHHKTHPKYPVPFCKRNERKKGHDIFPS